MRAIAVVLAAVAIAIAHPEAARGPLSGRVTFNGEAIPGASVTAVQGERTVSTTTDETGGFTFATLADGAWTVRADMRGFNASTRDITLPQIAGAAPLVIALTMQPLAEIIAGIPRPTSPAPSTQRAAAAEPDPVDIITGSVVNGATTVFAQPRAFGNNRPRQGSLYNIAVFGSGGDSAWNARPYSFVSPPPLTPSYGDLQLGANIGGPLRIPWLVRYGPPMQLLYQHSVANRATTQSVAMPTGAERAGDFSQAANVVRDPLTGQPFSDNRIPAERISPQAAALLAYYPPAPDSIGAVNFQRAIVSSTVSDRVQFGLTKTWRNRSSMAVNTAWQRSSADVGNLFGFDDVSGQSSTSLGLDWSPPATTRHSLHVRYQLTRTVSSLTPFFAGRTNVSDDAGIAGNDQDPRNWGPPTLRFADLAGLADGQAQRTSTLTHTTGAELSLHRGSHNITIGGDSRWIIADVRAQPDARGTLTFTGAATGDAFADFLLGIPSASAIALGGSTHLHGISPDAYVNDDWRIFPGVTLNTGLRWEYDSPFVETSGRLANLDIAPGVTAIAPVLAGDPVGSLTGTAYPASLIRPDRHGFEPRLGFSWRPSLASSLVFKGSYGLYRNLGGYQSLALLLSQQPPFAKAFNIQNSADTPLTLAQPFPSTLPTASNTFAIDPDFRAADAHTWQVSMQRELPASLTVLAAYLGAHGTHVMQASLPNTAPPGAATESTGPSGFIYLTSKASSLRNALQLTLRRRLYAGFTASAQYTLAKATDDAASFANGGVTPASLSLVQDWRNPDAEYAPSTFDQRHHLDVDVQYTTGVGFKGGTLVDGFAGSLWKDWTVAARLSAGSGMPFTPIAFLPVAGTGVVGIRPSLTGVSLAPVSAGSYVNAAAFMTPAAGTWGDAGRNALRGPSQFSLDMSVDRTFRFGSRINLTWRISATNVLNRVTFASVGAIAGSPQFGLPTVANPMRVLQTSIGLKF
ncbi:MAG TPA: carboxypeptidase-like regulatory domain-containing protein [Vicinamibacterales bacterium]